MKIIITETQYEFLIAEATTNPCPDNKKENELITLANATKPAIN